MANATKLASYVGRTGTWTLPIRNSTVAVRVSVTDARNAYGRSELLVTPVAGSGEAWANAKGVKLDKEAK